MYVCDERHLTHEREPYLFSFRLLRIPPPADILYRPLRTFCHSPLCVLISFVTIAKQRIKSAVNSTFLHTIKVCILNDKNLRLTRLS